MKMQKLLIATFLFITLVTPKPVHAMSAKGKAFMVMCAYGTVGGALLGFASMAYGTNPRAIAQGASLGLYAGILFGSYIIMSHKSPGEREAEYQNQLPYGGQQDTPPPPGPSPWGGAPGADPNQGGGGGFFDGSQRMLELNERTSFGFRSRLNNRSVPLYVPIMHYSF